MSLFRMTIRRWMIAVLLIGGLIHGMMLAQRSWRAWRIGRAFSEMAQMSAELETECLMQVTESRREIAFAEQHLNQSRSLPTSDSQMPERGSDEDHWEGTRAAHQIGLWVRQNSLNKCSEVRRYYERLEQKYRRAAWHPWLPIAPDPEPPELE